MVETLYSEPSFISGGRKYILRDTCGVMVGMTKFPETLVNPEDDYQVSNGIGYGIKVKFADVEDEMVVVMDEPQFKTLIKGMKAVLKNSKKGRRRFF